MSDPQAVPLDDEPRTPMWLPALGAAIFVVAALWWAVIPASQPATQPVASASASASAAPPAAPAVTPAGTPQQAALGTAPAAPSQRPMLAPGMASADAQQRMRELRERMKKGPGGPAHP
jgi:hypothetical protein